MGKCGPSLATLPGSVNCRRGRGRCVEVWGGLGESEGGEGGVCGLPRLLSLSLSPPLSNRRRYLDHQPKYSTSPRYATTKPHPLKCPSPGECLPVQDALGDLGTSRHSNQRLGAGAVAAGLALESSTERFEWCASCDLGLFVHQPVGPTVRQFLLAARGVADPLGTWVSRRLLFLPHRPPDRRGYRLSGCIDLFKYVRTYTHVCRCIHLYARTPLFILSRFV